MPCHNSIQHSKYLRVLLALRAPKSCTHVFKQIITGIIINLIPIFIAHSVLLQCFAYKALVYCAVLMLSYRYWSYLKGTNKELMSSKEACKNVK